MCQVFITLWEIHKLVIPLLVITVALVQATLQQESIHVNVYFLSMKRIAIKECN